MRPLAAALLLPSILAAAEAAPDPLAGQPLAAAIAPSGLAWKPVELTAPDRGAERMRIAETGARFLGALKAGKAAPSPAAMRAIDLFVQALASSDAPERPDALDPVFARRAVRGGALRGLGADAALRELEAAVAASARPAAISALAGDGGARLEERRDAFGVGGWVLSGPASAYAIAHSDPQFVQAPALVLAVELASAGEPDAAKATAARLLRDGAVIATWTAADGKLQADAKTWRGAVPEPRGRALARGLLPPHLVLAGLDGDPVRLVTAHGSVVPARDARPAESERFLAEAAKALPDAAHLDLIGQHLFRYVYDSPDPRYPLLIGSLEVKGEVHQTAAQILGSTTGGQCRGDCDDLAELYQTIAEKQGRLGHLLILPSHTAFAAARKDGEDWVVEVMQTGPTYAFRGRDLRDALRDAHRNFDAAAPFSPDHLGLLLRFSGENTRGPFGLGWRIFAEPEYARTMIDVQRDWQYQTYARAISKMKRMIEAGDRDPANLHELAALYEITGQWQAAVEGYRVNLEVLSDPVSRIEVQLELAASLRRAGKLDEARAELTRLAESLPELAPKLGQGVARLAMRLSLAQVGAGDNEGGRRTLMGNAFGPLAGGTARLVQMVSQPGFDRTEWAGDGRMAATRQLVQQFIGCLIVHLDKAGRKTVAGDPTLARAREVVDAWLARLAFLEADDPSEAIPIYAIAARIHALDLGPDALAKAVEAAKPPAAAAHDHLDRKLAPAAQSMAADLPWIRIAPGWWLGEVNRALRGGVEEDDEESGEIKPLDPAKIDRARVAVAAAGAVAAAEACRKLGFSGQQIELPVHFAQLTAAIVGGDDRLLRERLRYVKQQDDKRLRDGTAMTLGQLAAACDAKRWDAVLKAWADEVDYKPKWFSIAWVAAVAGAPQQALAAARAAAKRFPDEAAFREEVVFMEQLLGGKK